MVADELVAEFADPSCSLSSADQKNIRRRVYDALNVLMAMDILSKDKKEIQWKGLPQTTLDDIEELKKAAYLEELEEQYVGLRNLIQCNKQLYGSGNAPSGGVALPFILVQKELLDSQKFHVFQGFTYQHEFKVTKRRNTMAIQTSRSLLPLILAINSPKQKQSSLIPSTEK
ncbi:hypothetical protein OROHE_014831 [Orobanche hederae]